MGLPDRTKLRVGDKIRLLTVPQLDIEQRDRELQSGVAHAAFTVNAIERIIVQCPVVTIDRIDEYSPWFDVDLMDQNGRTEYHSLAIMDDDSWEYVES
jgi:hypothetical protein